MLYNAILKSHTWNYEYQITKGKNLFQFPILNCSYKAVNSRLMMLI